MSESYRALCSDFYINQKLGLKLDLPRERQTILDLFDRVRKQFAGMNQFRKFKEEIALESDPDAAIHRWVAVKASNIRSGSVNPADLAAGYELHRALLELTPFFLSISPLDVDYLELLFGFDLAADRNHDAYVAGSLLNQSPLAQLLDDPSASIVDFQPSLGLVLRGVIPDTFKASTNRDIEVTYEVKTRPDARQGGDAPISIWLTLRHYGTLRGVEYLPEVLGVLAAKGEELIEQRVIPALVIPIREALGPGF